LSDTVIAATPPKNRNARECRVGVDYHVEVDQHLGAAQAALVRRRVAGT